MAYTDLSYLNEITGGESSIVREMIEMFLEQVKIKVNLNKHLQRQKLCRSWQKLTKRNLQF